MAVASPEIQAAACGVQWGGGSGEENPQDGKIPREKILQGQGILVAPVEEVQIQV